MQEVRLNIGCGPIMLPTTWINYDRADFATYLHFLKTNANNDLSIYAESVQKCAKFLKNGEDFDFRIHDLRKGFSQHEDNSITSIYIGQVIEHLNPIYEVPKLLKECYRMLKPGGVIRVTTPDLDILLDAYMNNKMYKFASEQPLFYSNAEPSLQLSYLMFGACGENCTWDFYEGHMCMYNKSSMTKFLTDAQFKEIEFHNRSGKSKDPMMARDIVDAGMTHSFISEAIK